MDPVKFKIEFISPLLIGGAGKDSCDPLSLGKALRGAWRFWFRAVCGGRLQGNDPNRIKALHILENAVFGSTSKATFRMLVQRTDSRGEKDFPRCPHYTGGKAAMRKSNSVPSMVSPPHHTGGKAAMRKGTELGTTFEIIITPRKGMTPDALNALKATICLWGNLGSVGNRARRGFGSPILFDEQGFFQGIPLKGEAVFMTRDDMVKHLKSVINVSLPFIVNLMTTVDLTVASIKIPPTPLACSTDFFVFTGESQVMVSRNPSAELFAVDENKVKGLINKIHGSRSNNEIGRSDRQASPVYVRVHKTKEGYYPVATWSKQTITPVAPVGSGQNTALYYIKTCLGCDNDILNNPL